jgi:hypothetical protein
VPSTVIRSFSYRAPQRELDILFTTGRRYVYRDVPPEAAERLRSAFNKGRHFNTRIRGAYAFSEVAPDSDPGGA